MMFLGYPETWIWSIKIMKGIKDYKLSVISILDRTTYTSTQELYRFSKEILEAQEFSTNLSIRIKDKQKHLRESGHELGNPVYGKEVYRTDNNIRKFRDNASEQKIISMIKTRFKFNCSNYSKIASFLNNKGYRKRKRLWTGSSVRSVVINENMWNMTSLRNNLPTGI